MRASGWHSVAKATDTRRVESNFHAGPRDAQPHARRLAHALTQSRRPFRFRRQMHLRCGTTAQVMFITQADYDVYESMDAASVDVEFLWERLEPYVQHLGVYDRRRVNAALLVAYYAHDGQFRKSGEPFITHPVEVARILGSLGLDGSTIVAGLLHDTIEDTDRISLEEIQQRFGDHVRRIVEAETRLTKMKPVQPGDSSKELDFRHFFQCISQDVRIVLVKLADRLHNMRTMESMRLEKQIEKAQETLQIYAPLAAVLGLNGIKEEMEDLALRYLDPMRYRELKDHLEKLQKEQEDALEEARSTLEETLNNDITLKGAIDSVSVTCRQKSIYRLYELYKRAKWDLNGDKELRQVTQFHVTLKTMTASNSEAIKVCYCALGVVHLLWFSIPYRMQDSMTTPKPSPWKGLITTVMPNLAARLMTPVDVLIQTSEMSAFVLADWSPSELNACMQAGGFVTNGAMADDTSHGNALDSIDDNDFRMVVDDPGNGRTVSKTVSNRVNGREPTESTEIPVNGVKQGHSPGKLWFRNLQKWEQEIGMDMSPREYTDCVRDEFLSPSVYVFMHDGRVMCLPKGSTVLDFAYHIHTHIGNRAVGAKVDGRMVGPNYNLQNAQVVEILTHDWKISWEYLHILQTRMSAIRTTSARRKLRDYLKQTSDQLEKSNADMQDDRSSLVESESHLWIEILCQDEKGVLAELSRVIASHGLNITRHSGQKKQGGSFLVKINVHDPGGKHARELREALEIVKGCENVCMGCHVPSLVASPMGWFFPESNSRS